MLKWVKSEEEVVELVEDVKLMHKSGGFDLAKFLTNSKNVLKAVPACDRRKSVMECYFNNQFLSTEKALEIPLEYERRCIYIQNELEGKTKDKKTHDFITQ